MYNVYLFNAVGAGVPGNNTVPAKTLTTIATLLTEDFKKVVAAHDAKAPDAQKFGGAQVTWTTTPAPQDNELLLYFLPSGATIAQARVLKQGSPPPNHDGLTSFKDGTTASEAYLSNSDPNVLANLFFHEFMHNKLHLDNSMHDHHDGLGATPVGPNTPLTPANIAEMGAALGKKQPQWVGGVPILTAAVNVPDADPSKGLF
jgi:hypothetical protein